MIYPLFLKRKFLIANLAIYEYFSLFLPPAACWLCPVARSLSMMLGKSSSRVLPWGSTRGSVWYRTEKAKLNTHGVMEVMQIQVGIRD